MTQSPTFAPATPGELPPPAPKLFFGRSELVETIVNLTQRLTSIALTGTGGIGKTSIILTVLNDSRVKQRFGDSRSFIRCDRLIPSHTHFLRKLSEAIGAGAENPEDLSPLRRDLSSKEMIIVLDNAESILGLAEVNTQEIYMIVDELSQFSNICLVITSRISNVLPPTCEIIEVPTLSMEAGHETFYGIYRLGKQSDQISEILKELDFHPLSIALLATIAYQNRWNAKRLTTEWENQRTGVLRARNLGSLEATVELSLASPMFLELGPDAREVLGVVAFFPQGVNEDNVDEEFPTISDGPNTFDAFCNLSLTYRSHGFITMLAPLRDYLCPKDPMASPLLLKALEHYIRRLSADLYPTGSVFDESQWITSEDVNVEHLLDIFTSIDPDMEEVWRACNYFMAHLSWHKPRLVILGPKVEALPDNHPSKPRCLGFLSQLFGAVGHWTERKRLLIQGLRLWGERRDDYEVADTLAELSDVNCMLGLHKEGFQQARGALDIFERLGKTEKQARCLLLLASFLREDEQFDVAEEAASHAMDLLENHDQYRLCHCHKVLGSIHQSKGDREKAIHHFEASLRISSSINSHGELSRTHLALAILYYEEDKFNEAHDHIEHTKLYVGNDTLGLGCALRLSARVLFAQNRPEEAKSEALDALAIVEKLGAKDFAEETRQFLKEIEELDGDGKRLKWCSLFTPLIRTQTPNPYEGDKDCPAFFYIPLPGVDVRKP